MGASWACCSAWEFFHLPRDSLALSLSPAVSARPWREAVSISEKNQGLVCILLTTKPWGQLEMEPFSPNQYSIQSPHQLSPHPKGPQRISCLNVRCLILLWKTPGPSVIALACRLVENALEPLICTTILYTEALPLLSLCLALGSHLLCYMTDIYI